MVRYFKALTATIPIVALTSDPVANGFAESFARPGGNITGVVPEPAYSVLEKRFEMIRETLPNVRTVAVLAPEAVLVSAEGREWEQTAQGLGLKMVPWGSKVLLTRLSTSDYSSSPQPPRLMP